LGTTIFSFFAKKESIIMKMRVWHTLGKCNREEYDDAAEASAMTIFGSSAIKKNMLLWPITSNGEG
jgi:hypothetical protein